MKSLTTLLLSTVLAGGTLAAHAGSSDARDLATCKSELTRLYGEETRLKLAGIQNNRNGTRMKISARPGNGESHLVTCWVDREGMTNLVNRQGEVLLVGAAHEADQVTLNR
jgi:hypothetical protein